MKRIAFAAALWLISAASAFAATSGQFVPILGADPYAPTGGNVAGPPSGFVSQNLVVQSSTDWTSAQLIVDLTAGSFYNHAAETGMGQAPNSAFFGFAPDLRWDTYVSGWAPYSGATTDAGAVDLGGSITATFPSSLAPSVNDIDISWFTLSTTDFGPDPASLGRFTVSSNATGTWKLALFSVETGSSWVEYEGNVVGGFFVPVPEPSAIILGCCGAAGVVGMAIRRRRKALMA